MSKNEYKKRLLNMLEENPDLKYGNSLYEAIYFIDDIVVYGYFKEGYRGVDHNILIGKNYNWNEIAEWGTIVIPETKYYVSDEEISFLESMGYDRLPISDYL